MGRSARVTIRAAAGCAAGLAVGMSGLSVGAPGAGAAVSAGAAEIVDPSTGARLSSGDSRTDFRIGLPSGAACRGDSAKDGYRVQSYLVPEHVDLDTLTFDASGPAPVPGQFRAPLYEATFDANSYVDRLTAEAVPVGGPGLIIQPLPAFSFAAYDPAFGFPFTPGVYNVGITCTVGAEQEKHWNTVLTITADPADSGKAKIRWSVTAAAQTAATRPPGGWLAFIAGAALIIAGGVFVLRRHQEDLPHTSRPSRTQPVKETR